MTAIKEKVETTEATNEQTLRAKISALDKKIEAQRKHIAKLERELASKRTERAHLIRQRIDLLQRELPTDDDGNKSRSLKDYEQ